MAVITIQNLAIYYHNRVQAICLPGILQLYNGDFVLLNGASGCGKSSILYVLTGIIPHVLQAKYTGIITFADTPLEQLTKQQRHKIAYMAQNPHQQTIMHTVREEIAFSLEYRFHDISSINTHIEHISTEMNITALLDKPIYQLSLGEKQHISLIALLARKPHVLLLDEPCAFLDDEKSSQLFLFLHTYCSDMCIICIDHANVHAKKWANRIITMHDDNTYSESTIHPTITFPKIITHTPHTQCILSIKDLYFSYNTHSFLLSHINLHVHKGEIIGIIGNNGQGKTTLFHCIAAIQQKYTGQIYINTIQYSAWKKKHYFKQFLYSSQNPEYHFHHDTVIAEVHYNTTLLQQFNLYAVAQQSPFTLSEGEKRRLSIACMLTSHRSLALFDEPTFGLDAQSCIMVMNVIKTLSLQNYACVIISHDTAFLQACTHALYHLHNGILYTYKN